MQKPTYGQYAILLHDQAPHELYKSLDPTAQES
jgi:hypothetical protein